MSDLREYTAMKYMGDCKCGKCQLVPRHVLDECIAERDAMVRALRTIAAMDPKGIRADDLGRAARIAAESAMTRQPHPRPEMRILSLIILWALGLAVFLFVALQAYRFLYFDQL